MRVLVVDPRGGEGDLLREMLVTLGHSAYHVEAGLTALTMIERHSPEAWLISLELEDLRVAELCASIRLDPASAHCLLLAYSHEPLAGQAPPIPEGADGLWRTEGDLVALAYLSDREMRKWHQQRARERWSPEAHSLRSFAGDARGVEGSFGVVSFAELVQMIGLAGRRLVLSVRAAGEGGTLYFKRGVVVHAECAGAQGWTAIERITRGIQEDGASSFRVERADPRVLEQLPHSVGLPSEQMLLRLAVEVDQQGLQLPSGDRDDE